MRTYYLEKKDKPKFCMCNCKLKQDNLEIYSNLENIKNVIKNGKNVLLNNVSNNIKKELDEQVEYVKKMESEVSEWKKCYNNKDFDGMEKAYKKIEKQYEKIVPIENLINETKQVKALHELIKNNGKNFNIVEDEKRLAKNLA